MTTRRWVASLVLIFAVAIALRALWPRADPPPATAGVGIVWHDEGPWTHNARNKALWGVWRTDNWNPMFIAPVFTAFEYASFRAFGVGTWQARVVPIASGLLALAFLIAGLAALAGRPSALIGGALLGVNFCFVMWNRAALMESTMTAFIVVAWAAYAMADARPRWGFVAGLAVVLAWFSKEAAAFFAAAIVIDGLTTIWLARRGGASGGARGVWFMFAGLAVGGVAAFVCFVLPHWREFTFYNWQMTVERKPSYALHDLVMRASWLPIVQNFFTRMWVVVCAAAIAIVAIVTRWRRARPAERLLVLWIAVGMLELIVHDSGNERRYVMFIPALIALAAVLAGSARPLFAPAARSLTMPGRAVVAVVLLALGYLVFGSLLHPLFPGDLAAGRYSHIVWLAAALSVIAAVAWLSRWSATTGWLSARAVPAGLVLVLLGISVAWNLVEYGMWARDRRYTNYDASVQIGKWLPPGTLVQGKLANGLSLENRIRPLFIGNGFGNYADRLTRDDVRYILTYVLPSLGYESEKNSTLIPDVLNHYPQHRAIHEFDVDETGGRDRAALFDKFPDRH